MGRPRTHYARTWGTRAQHYPMLTLEPSELLESVYNPPWVETWYIGHAFTPSASNENTNFRELHAAQL